MMLMLKSEWSNMEKIIHFGSGQIPEAVCSYINLA